MPIAITDEEITSEKTQHVARRMAADVQDEAWSVSWLPARVLTRNQAITAMTISELVASHDVLGDPMHSGHRLWPLIDNLARELGISGPHAVVETSISPQEHAGTV